MVIKIFVFVPGSASGLSLNDVTFASSLRMQALVPALIGI